MPALAPLAATLSRPGTLLLDTSRPAPGEPRRSLLFHTPVRVLRADALADVLPLLDALDAAIDEGYHVAGYLAYEAGYAFENIAAVPPGAPLGWFGVYEAPLVLPQATVDDLLAAFAHEAYAITDGHFALDPAPYADKIAAIKTHIQAGDVYQINFTADYAFGFSGSPLALFHDLRRKQRVAYGAFLRLEDTALLSLSPELFFAREGRHIATRPMKGTVRRGRTPEEDARLAAWLTADEKSRAENLMIVDLLRNDLSVVCVPGTVRVPALFTVETYQTLLQMTSTVEGVLRENIRYADLFRALFPCGSVTGAPKIRAMEIIHKLEAGPRGVYCGAIGYIAPGEAARFNVAIRTLVLGVTEGRMGTGGGIVWDADADAEYAECLLKTRFLTDPPAPPFALIETMRWEDGTLPLLPLHLDRLRASAHYFGFPFDEAALRARLAAATAVLPTEQAHKVRLTLDADGTLHLTTSPLSTPSPEHALRVCFADAPIDETDPFFYHKTTRRAVYEDAYQDARAHGYDEVLFVNRRGEVTEAARANVFIRRGERWLTPPRNAGLLAGVYRRRLLATLPHAQEHVLFPQDLVTADAVYLCNAVRGLRAVDRASFVAERAT